MSLDAAFAYAPEGIEARVTHDNFAAHGNK
jgi:hypothetical protein